MIRIDLFGGARIGRVRADSTAAHSRADLARSSEPIEPQSKEDAAQFGSPANCDFDAVPA